MRKKIVIIGATSTIAEFCAKEWILETNTEIILVGRNAEQLEIISQDLLVRAPQNRVAIIILTDFTDPTEIKNMTQEICARGIPDIVLIAHGCLPEQKKCQHDLLNCKAALEINGISPILFAEAFAEPMDNANGGTIAVIGSVAGDRGRESNYIYGAGKELVARYIQGMQQRFHGRNVRIILIKPGPTDTKMTARLKNSRLKLADPSKVAACIIKGIKKRKLIIYVPKKWAIIMMIIRHTPTFIIKKLKI
ncbi:SDR family NAD(P)-dependent oxidoreductase [Legionella sp.]|uniref:SDR family NAD(P)-dependent oxidoreductase n=1 Tax=Legionella sp. TaxID=459 RepID=UPI003C7FBC9A